MVSVLRRGLKRRRTRYTPAVLEAVEELELDLGLVLSVQLEVVDGNANLGGEDVDGLGGLRLGDLDIAKGETTISKLPDRT